MGVKIPYYDNIKYIVKSKFAEIKFNKTKVELDNPVKTPLKNTIPMKKPLKYEKQVVKPYFKGPLKI